MLSTGLIDLLAGGVPHLSLVVGVVATQAGGALTNPRLQGQLDAVPVVVDDRDHDRIVAASGLPPFHRGIGDVEEAHSQGPIALNGPPIIAVLRQSPPFASNEARDAMPGATHPS